MGVDRVIGQWESEPSINQNYCMQQWLNLLFQLATPVFNTLVYAGTSHLLSYLQDELENEQKQQAKQMLGSLRIGSHLKVETNRKNDREKPVKIGDRKVFKIQDPFENITSELDQADLNFQLSQPLKAEQSLQQQWVIQKRETLLQLAAYQRETNLLLPEVQKNLDSWPLRLFPSQLLESPDPNRPIPLRVLLAPPQIPSEAFDGLGMDELAIERRLAQGLREFLSRHYSLHSQVRPTEFLGGIWENHNFRGESSIKALFQVLQSQPTLILESEIEGDTLNFRLAYWGLEQEKYCYETVFTLSYREFLEESAKARAWQWKETRDKLLAMGKTPEEVKRFGGENADNLALLEEAEALQTAGIDLRDLACSYQVGRKDFEALCQFLTTCHYLVAGWVADIHYLIHQDLAPILPELLPQLVSLEQTSLWEVIRTTISLYQEVLKALASERSNLVPELTLKLAQSIAHLPDRSWAREQVNTSLRTWLHQHQLSPLLGLEALASIPLNLTARDRNYLETLQTCLSTLGDERGAIQVQELLEASINCQHQPQPFTLSHTVTGLSGTVISFALSPDGQNPSGGGDRKPIETGKLPQFKNSCKEVRPIILQFPTDGEIFTFTLSRDGQTLVSSDRAGHRSYLKIWNLPERKLRRTLFGHRKQIRSLAISLDGQILASASHKIKLWDLKTGESFQTLFGHKEWVSALAIGVDGQTVISGSEDKTIRIWNLRTGQLLRTLNGHQGCVRTLALSPDGKTLISGSDDRTIELWDLPTGKRLRTSNAHSGAVYALALTPNGQHLISGGADRTIKIWHLQSFELLQTLTGHLEAVQSIALSADGQTLVSRSRDQMIKIWGSQSRPS
jgi:WD40 repeat protein